MDWITFLIVIFTILSILFLIGVPVAFSFLFVNILFAYIFWGDNGFSQLILSIYRSLSLFSLVPVPLFILMGQVIFLYGISHNLMETMDKWVGKLPGRLSLMAVAGVCPFATLALSAQPCWARRFSPRWKKKGYKAQMTLGPIMEAGALPE